MKKVLFVCYGSGHVKMVLPVARALRDGGRAEVAILGLTTAAPLVRAAGLPLLQFKDFLQTSDAAALAHGQRLLAVMGPVDDPDETVAYLGLSYADLEEAVGPAEAAVRHARLGRQAFLPQATLRRILQQVRPDLVVATNSPRAERAAVLAARQLGLPAVCIVDLFAIDEVQWIGEAGYADMVCVLNESVRQFLIGAGRRPDEVVVTGNPGFDALQDPAAVVAGQALRERQGWQSRQVLLWAAQEEPTIHPFDGRPGDPTLPTRALAILCDWAGRHPDAVLCIRSRSGMTTELPTGAPPNALLTGQDWSLVPLLHAADLVVTLTSTVGLEGHLVGTRLVQVRGSVFEKAMPLALYGIADEAVPVNELAAALSRQAARPSRQRRTAVPAAATARVVDAVARFI